MGRLTDTSSASHDTAADHPVSWGASRAFLKLAIAVTVVGVAVFDILLLVYAPEQKTRALTALLLVMVAVIAGIFLRCGNTRACIVMLSAGAWAYIVIASFLYGGVGGSSIVIFPLIVLLLGWLVSVRAALLTAILTIFATLAMVVAEIGGYLPVPPPTPPTMRWVILCGVFILTAFLISHVVTSYRERLKEVRELGVDLDSKGAALRKTEADLNRAQAVAHIGSWVYELNADRMTLSPETCRIFGLRKRNTGSYKTYRLRVHPEDRDTADHAWQEALKSGASFDSEHRIVIGRTVRWVRQRAEFEFDTGGTPLRAVGTTQDITERKLAEEALRKSEMELQCILGATADGILAVDLQGRVMHVNRRFADMWRVPQVLLERKDDRALLNHVLDQLEDPSAFLGKVQALYVSDAQMTDTVHFRDGRTFERFTSPLKLNDAIVGRVWSFRDISERKRAEAERARLESQLRESQKMEALGTLAGGIAHDFNNALAVISGNVTLAAQDIDSDHPARQSLDEIAKASRRAKALVSQILAFGRRQVLERKRIALEPVLEESMRLLRATQPAGVTTRLTCAPDAPPVMADAAQIEQIMVNLCTNAWHAVEGGPRPGVVEIRLALHEQQPGGEHGGGVTFSFGRLQDGRYACLSVGDNGSGMDEATQRRIFEPFFTTKEVGKGTGLGLAVVHGIAQGHDAVIEIDSAIGRGTEIRLYFPEAIDVPDVREPAPPAALHDAPGKAERPAASGKHVLYVDDDEALVFLIQRLLQQQGYRVSGYNDPAKALAALQADAAAFDLVVTDYNMPVISGLAIAQAVKTLRPDLPVAMASGYLTDDLRARAIAAGVRELIYKPNTVEDLCAAVARLL